jgi:hypothetical protein
MYASDAIGPGTFWAHQTYLWHTASVYASDTCHSGGIQLLVCLRWLSALSQPGPTSYTRGVQDLCTPRVLYVAEERNFLYAMDNLALHP